MAETKPTRVPRSFFVIIVLILAGMYYYAAYIDNSGPEKTVENFYQAYFNRDFTTVSQNLSVLWGVRLLPQYSAMPPAELLKNRARIEKDVSGILAEAEKNNQIPENTTISILKEYTKEGKNSAVVVYAIKENGKTTYQEAAILVREENKLRILQMVPVNEQTLEQVKQIDINTLDSNFESLYTTSK